MQPATRSVYRTPGESVEPLTTRSLRPLEAESSVSAPLALLALPLDAECDHMNATLASPAPVKHAAILALASRVMVAERGKVSKGGACTLIDGTGIAARVMVIGYGGLEMPRTACAGIKET